MQLECLDLGEVVRDVLTLVRGTLTRHSVQLDAHIGGVPIVQGVRVEVQQLLLNLILNASDAMNPRMPPRIDGLRSSPPLINTAALFVPRFSMAAEASEPLPSGVYFRALRHD